MLYNLLRPGAIGNVIMSSCVTSQLKERGHQIHYYTKCFEAAKRLEGVDAIFDSDNWSLRFPGKDIVLQDIHNDKHLNENYCIQASLNSALMKLKSQPRIKEGNYITFQRKAGWSSLKCYSHWDKVLSKLPLEYIELDEKTPWNETFSLIQYASLHLGIDSCCQHISAAYKVPSVILWGSSSPKQAGYDSAINLWKCGCEENCRIEDVYQNGNRCNDKCKLHPSKCIDDISVEEVLNAIESLMANKK